MPATLNRAQRRAGMLVPEDLWNPNVRSNYNHVRQNFASAKSNWGSGYYGYRAEAGRKQKGHKGWYGPSRATAREAAQDYCDYVNSLSAGMTQDEVEALFSLRSGLSKLSPVERKARVRTGTRKDPFPERMKKAIHKRARGLCEGCGVQYDHPDAHHIDDQGDHSMENGASICKNCHGHINLGCETGKRINDKLRSLRKAGNP